MPEPKAILFAPRGGFAWTPFEARHVIRGGFGWAYNRNNIADSHQSVRERPRRPGEPRADQLQHDGVTSIAAADPGAKIRRA